MLAKYKHATKVAERLRDELGEGALSFVSTRVEAARAKSDQIEVQRWNEIAQELLRHVERTSGAAAPEDGNLLWAFMQRIEYCRHRAMKAERQAAAGSGTVRQELADLARQWRDLALYADLLAQLAERDEDGEAITRQARQP